MKLQYIGKLTAGYYNDMEAGRPVFIDSISLSNIVKQMLLDAGENDEFCFDAYEDIGNVKNPLIGKKVKLTLEIGE